MTVNFDDINYIITIADCKSFTKAAQCLFITPSALSHRIKNLEKYFGVQLFRRNSNTETTPTQKGAEIIKACREIYKSEQLLFSILGQNTTTFHSNLNIAVCRYFTESAIFSDFLRKFYLNNKSIKLELSEFSYIDVFPLINSAAFQAGFSYDCTENGKVGFIHLFTDELVFIPARGSELDQKLASRYENGAFIPWTFLENTGFAIPTADTVLYPHIQRMLVSSGISYTVTAEGKHVTDLMCLARTGISSTFCYKNLFNMDCSDLRYYRLENSRKIELGLLYNKQIASENKRTPLNHLIQFARDYADSSVRAC